MGERKYLNAHSGIKVLLLQLGIRPDNLQFYMFEQALIILLDARSNGAGADVRISTMQYLSNTLDMDYKRMTKLLERATKSAKANNTGLLEAIVHNGHKISPQGLLWGCVDWLTIYRAYLLDGAPHWEKTTIPENGEK